ncbi:MAG TPA: archaeosortase/exosortase family protein [Balneolales bacterium]|nr:archaeosortase/exosortase family protein [Balneolales bacterium]
MFQKELKWKYTPSKPILVFFLKGLVVYLIWYILYNIILSPSGHLDAWLEHKLVTTGAGMLRLFGYSVFTYANVLGIQHMSGIQVATGCNGLSAIGLFLGFIIAYPGDTKKRLMFIPLGCMMLYLSNVLRLCLLTLTQYYQPAAFDFMHHYAGDIFFYLVIFLLWLFWANWGQHALHFKPIRRQTDAMG